MVDNQIQSGWCDVKIAYFSPFPPEQSGIADFSYELLTGFTGYSDAIQIDIFYPEKTRIQDLFSLVNIYDLSYFDDASVRECYDHFVYHVGNNIKYHKWIVETFKKYPGILELHDLSLHYYLAEDTWLHGDIDEYIKIMKYCHGNKGEQTASQFINSMIRAPWETSSDVYTVNKHLVDIAKAVIVHSDYAKQMIKGIRHDVPVINIPLHTSDLVHDYIRYKTECRKKLSIGSSDIVMGTFGFATTAKRIQQIVEALKKYLKNPKNTEQNILLYIVGKLEDRQVIDQIQQYGMENNIIIKGYVDLDEMKVFIGACDFCFNLRYPSQGESSASLHRMLGMGKPVVITRIAAFEEYPDEFSVKISHGESEVDEIFNAICLLSGDSKILGEKGEAAYQYAINNCTLEINIQRYIRFFLDLTNGRLEDDYIDMHIDRIINIGIDKDEDYIRYFAKNIFSLSMSKTLKQV